MLQTHPSPNSAPSSPIHTGKDDVLGYDIESTDVIQTREVTVQSNGKRFRILMELAKGCYGNCSGCSLSTTERNVPPPIDLAKVKAQLKAFISVINEKKHLRTTVVNYGVGDYFLFDENTLEGLASVTRQFFAQLNTQRNVISLSTSLLSKPEKMAEKVARIKKHLHPTQVLFDAVIDPERIKEHFDAYTRNLTGLTDAFAFVDVVVNVHKGLTEENAYWVHQFARHAKVLNLDIQYAVHKDNRYRVQINPDEFEPFWKALWSAFEAEQASEKITLSMTDPIVDDELSLPDLIHKNVVLGLDERVLVDQNDQVWAVGFGFGDVLLDERFNVAPVGHIQSGRLVWDTKGIHKLERALLNQANSAVCASCEHVKKCYGTGYGWYQLQTDTPGICGNPARLVFER
jgi:hypothetical protein